VKWQNATDGAKSKVKLGHLSRGCTIFMLASNELLPNYTTTRADPPYPTSPLIACAAVAASRSLPTGASCSRHQRRKNALAHPMQIDLTMGTDFASVNEYNSSSITPMISIR
jgi:hypothetical protein